MVSLEFFIDIILPPHYGPGDNSASNRNEYQEYFLAGKGGQCVGLTTLPPSCADCLEIWEPQPPGTLRACPGLQRDCFTFTTEQREPYDSTVGEICAGKTSVRILESDKRKCSK